MKLFFKTSPDIFTQDDCNQSNVGEKTNDADEAVDEDQHQLHVTHDGQCGETILQPGHQVLDARNT